MSNIEPASSGTIAETTAIYPETVRERVWSELVRRNLGAIVVRDGSNLDIVDAGGTTDDAVWLASLGHRVTVLDSAEDWLHKAQGRLDTILPEIAARVRLQLDTAQTHLAHGGKGFYDLVLSHRVAGYASEPGFFVRSLTSLVKPGGHISLVEMGYDGIQNRLIRDQRYGDAHKLRETGRMVDDEGRTVGVFTPSQLRHMIRKAGATAFDWYGVGITTDFDMRDVTDVPPEELETIVDEQYRAGRRNDLHGAGPLLHFIAQIG
jgi:2-polyprenyl-3-methyl-5-hydroxy-6-metoxy-1,4-benzoquinol methylase